MKEYLLLFRGGNERSEPQTPEKRQQEMQRWMKWMSDLTEQGKFAGAQPLNSGGKVISGTKKVVTDGPFMEGKELLGGYLICRAKNYEEAIEISNGCPILEFESGTVEIREIQDMNM